MRSFFYALSTYIRKDVLRKEGAVMVIRLKKLLSILLGVLLILLGCFFLLHAVLTANADGSARRAQVSAPVRQIDAASPMVALTFDDGPYTPVTGRILDALQLVNGRATFFVVGSRIEGREEILRRIADSGCELGNHTYDHVTLRGMRESEIRTQLEKADEKIFSVTGQRTTVLRPPSGMYDASVFTICDKPLVLWTIDTMDWKHQKKENSVQRVLENVKDGDIVLMHDLFFPTAEAAEELIAELSARGFQLVTITELLTYRPETEAIRVK